MKIKEHKVYYNNGKLQIKYYTKNDEYEGKSIHYCYNGDISYETYYDKGKMISKEEYLINKIRRILK